MSTGAVFVVTGANSGLGFATAQNLAALSPENTVVLACRDPRRGEDARLAIVAATGNERVRAMQLDVSSLASVREFAALWQADGPRIAALICNAGISRGSEPTPDGIDPVFATNHLGHFLLTLLLLDELAPAGRVVAVSSDMHSPPGPRLSWPGADALVHPGARTKRLRYPYSKLSNIYFVHELSRRLRAEGSGVSAAAFNPGLMTETNFAAIPRPVAAVMRRLFASRLGSLARSATALAELATRGDGAAIDGQYFDRSAATWTRSSELSYDAANARELWDVSERLTGQRSAARS